MKNVALVVVALGLLACNNPRPVIVITDSGGPAIDSGTAMGHDTGPVMGHDSGPAMGGCSITVSATSFGSLSAGCFTRCSAATLTAINACPATDDGTCLNAALMSDTTPTIPWTQNGMASTMPLDCAGCFGTQQLHCISANGCTSQVTAYIQCDPTMAADMCQAQIDAINTCAMTNQTAIGTCTMSATMGIQACFG